MQRKSAIIICGNAATGKSTYGQTLATQIGAALFDIDTVSEILVRAGLKSHNQDPDDRDSPRYKRVYRAAIHDTLFRLARANLSTIPCIIVAPFTQERRTPTFLATLEKELSTTVRVIYLTCSDEVRRERIIRRGNARDSSKLKHWESYAAGGRDKHAPPFEHEFIDTGVTEASKRTTR